MSSQVSPGYQPASAVLHPVQQSAQMSDWKGSRPTGSLSRWGNPSGNRSGNPWGNRSDLLTAHSLSQTRASLQAACTASGIHSVLPRGRPVPPPQTHTHTHTHTQAGSWRTLSLSGTGCVEKASIRKGPNMESICSKVTS